jgi:hypothetical protein
MHARRIKERRYVDPLIRHGVVAAAWVSRDAIYAGGPA